MARAQTVHEFRTRAARSAAVLSNTIPAGARVVSISDFPAFSGYIPEELRYAHRDGLGAVRGLWIAFVLECGAGLLIYGLWHLWHLAR